MSKETISAWEWKQICHARTTEKQWQQRVEGVLRQYGFLVFHTLRSKGSTPGFPDICAVKGERLLFIELKTEKGKLSEHQRTWLDALAAVPCAEVHVWRPEVHVWRPSQFDEVLEVASS